MTVEVRRAVPADAATIANIRVTSWRESYTHLLSAERLARLDAGSEAPRWRQSLGGTRSTIWIAERDGDAVGFAVARPPRDADAPRDLELGLIYVLEEAQGSRAGQALLDAAIGDAPAMLWVAEDNPRAHAFYRRNGFRADGARKVEHEWEGLVAVRLVR